MLTAHWFHLAPRVGDTYFWNYETVDLAPYLKRQVKT